MVDTPRIAAWSLALRFGLELTALVGLGVGAWGLFGGVLRWVAAAVFMVGAAGVWGTFNVAGDPSRSGAAPVAVSGLGRLAVEASVLGAGAVGLVVGAGPVVGGVFIVLVVFHYVASVGRVKWLLGA